MSRDHQPLTPIRQFGSPLVKEHTISVFKSPVGPELVISVPSTPIRQLFFNEDPNSPQLMSPLKDFSEKENYSFCTTFPFKMFFGSNTTVQEKKETKKLERLQKELNQTHHNVQMLKEKTEKEISNLIQSNYTLKLSIKEEEIKSRVEIEKIQKENEELRRENEELRRENEEFKRIKENERELELKRNEEREKEQERKLMDQVEKEVKEQVVEKEVNKPTSNTIKRVLKSCSNLEVSSFVLLISIVILLF
jgi:hypothetical protein